MTAPTFNLNSADAKQASGGAGKIDDLGKYVGKIKFAKFYKTDSGANFVSINFVSDAGAYANIVICTHGKNGQPTFGSNQIQAIMACLKLRTITPIDQVVDDYDHDAGKVQPCERTVYKEMTGASLGLAMYREDSTYNGKDKSVMCIAAPFNFDTEQTAAEVLDNKPAEQLEKVVQSLKNIDKRAATQSAGGYDSMPPNNDPGFDQDIPF